MVPISAMTNSHSMPEAQAAEPIVNCQVVVGQQTRVVCSAAGLVVLNTQINVPTITLPPLPGSTETIRIPAGPQPTKTVTVTKPGPTQTVTVRPEANATVRETQTITSEPSSLPTATATATVTERARQAPTEYVTVSSDTRDEEENIPFVPDTTEEVVKAGIGTILALVLIILALWLGYYLGYKNSEKENVTFLRAMRDTILVRNK